MNIDELIFNIGNKNFDSMTQQKMLDYYQELLDANETLQVRLTDLQKTNSNSSQEEFNKIKENMAKINSEIVRVTEAISKHTESQMNEPIQPSIKEDFTEINDNSNNFEKSSIKRNLDRINEVNNRISERINELFEEQNPYVEMDPEIITLNGEITSLNNEINIARNEVYAYVLNYRKSNLENNLKKATDRYNARGEELSENGVDYTSQYMDSEYNAISNEINSIQGEINNLNEYTEMYSETRMGNLERQLTEARKQLAEVNTNLHERMNTLADEGNNYPQIDEEVISLNGQMTAINEQIITLNGLIQNMKEEIKENAFYLRMEELENALANSNKKIEEKEIELDNDNISYNDRYMNQEYINVCRERDYIKNMIKDLKYKHNNNLLTDEIFNELNLPVLPKKTNNKIQTNQQNDIKNTSNKKGYIPLTDEEIKKLSVDKLNEKLNENARELEDAFIKGDKEAEEQARRERKALLDREMELKKPKDINNSFSSNGSSSNNNTDNGSNTENSEDNEKKKVDDNAEELDSDIEKHPKIDSSNNEKEELRKQKIKKAAIGALGGAMGFGLSFALQPGTAGIVISVGRLSYSATKKGLKVYTEKHKDDENNKIIKMVENVKDFTKEQAEKHPKITSAVSKVNNLLKKPEMQVFLNGMATGYTIGKISQAVYKMHEVSAMEKSGTLEPAPTPEPDPTPQSVLPEPDSALAFDPSKPVDLSSLGEGYVSSYSSDPVSLITSAGKNAMFDKINVVDGKTWVHFTQENGAGYAWFPADEVVKALNLSDISELTGEVSGGMHL